MVVRVRDLPDIDVRAFERQWRAAVFELLNAAYATDRDRLISLVRDGKLSKAEWVDQCAQIEYQALVDRSYFFQHTWMPWSLSSGAPATVSKWTVPPSYREWLARYDHPEGYPWKPYAANLDRHQRR